MKLATFFALIVFSACGAIGQEAPGLYADQAGTLVKMDHAPLSGSATKGVLKSAFVPGVMPGVVWNFPGAHAPVNVAKNPRFVYKTRAEQEISERDLVIVRMDQKSDRREIRVGKQSAWTGNVRSGFDQDRVIPIKVVRTGDKLEITTIGELPAGEYFLTAGFSPQGFDFAVSK
jgi:hypothetical protein